MKEQTGPKFIYIATGVYTYTDKDGTTQQSHALYGLCEDNKVWKFIPKTNTWIQINSKTDENIN